MARTVLKSEIGEIFQKLYESEINVRFEWWVDGGFTWSVLTATHDQLPRIIIDDEGAAGAVVLKSIEDFDEQIRPPTFIEPDWLARGSDEEIEIAIGDLSEKVCEYFPNSEFAMWFRRRVIV